MILLMTKTMLAKTNTFKTTNNYTIVTNKIINNKTIVTKKIKRQ